MSGRRLENNSNRWKELESGVKERQREERKYEGTMRATMAKLTPDDRDNKRKTTSHGWDQYNSISVTSVDLAPFSPKKKTYMNNRTNVCRVMSCRSSRPNVAFVYFTFSKHLSTGKPPWRRLRA